MAEATIVDLVENACDGLPDNEAAATAIATSRADEMAEHIDRLYQNWRAPALDEGEMRTNAAGINRRVVGDLLKELLYAHTAIVYDPIEWALRSPQRRPEEIAEGLMTLKLLAPLISAGIVLAVPGRQILAERDEEITKTAWEIVGDPAAFWWDLWGQTTDPYGQRPLIIAKPWALHLAVANATGAHLVPTDVSTYRLHEWTLERTAEQFRLNQLELLMAPRVFAAKLPWLEPTDPKTLISIREQDETFEEWRRALRRSTRSLRSLPGDERFAAEAQQAFDDELGSAVEALQTRSARALVTAARPSCTFALSAVGLVGATALTGVALAPALAGAGVGFLASYMTNLLIRESDAFASVPVAALGALVRDKP